jgi:hypothetical protein
MIVTPIILGTTIVLSFYQEFTKPYEGYPAWARISGGWAVVCAIIILSLIFMLKKVKGRGQTRAKMPRKARGKGGKRR